MDKYQEFFPNEKIPFSTMFSSFPEMYYICGEMEKGDDFTYKLMKNCCEKVEYYGNMKPKFRQYYQKTINEQIEILYNDLLGAASDYHREELENQLTTIVAEYLQKYYKDSDSE